MSKPQVRHWQPIETASIGFFEPETWWKSATQKYLLWDKSAKIGVYEYTRTGRGRWVSCESGSVIHPTHWRKLPPGPADT